MPKRKIPVRGLTSIAGKAEENWQTMRDLNGFERSSWQYQCYDFLCKTGTQWGKALDVMSRVDDPSLKELYLPTACHYVARLQGLKYLISTMPAAAESSLSQSQRDMIRNLSAEDKS